ncbi:MAG TPA: ATP-binding protein [Bacteroidota bacterium]|nr:ATP-binding protein [Bacteroidota bacterium]
MFRPFRSIRAKLTLWYTFIFLLTLVAFGLISYTYSSQQLSNNLDRSLQNEVRWVKNFIEGKLKIAKPSQRFARKKGESPPSGGIDTSLASQEASESDELLWNQIYEHALVNPKKTIIEVTSIKWGAIVFRSFPVEVESLGIGEIPLNTIKIQTVNDPKGTDLRVAATRTSDLDIYVAYPLSELREVLDDLYAIFLVLIPVMVTISVGGGWWLANKSLKPVDEITRTAKEITAQNLDRKIPERPVNDEFGRLVSTFNEMILRLRNSFDQIRQFSGDASHELRTPLTIMRGEVELALRRPKDPDEYRRVLVSNLEEIQRLSRIVDNLLTLSKAEFGRGEILMMEQVNLHDLVSELYEDCEVIATKKNIALQLTKNEDVIIPGDRIKLRQLLMNLVDNAIKYTPEGGRITLISERQNGNAVIRVNDTGIGIPKEEQRNIFDRFYRVDKARSRELGGSGLGLSIAKWIAELHRGRIEVESEPARGSKFTVTLPLQTESAESRAGRVA